MRSEEDPKLPKRLTNKQLLLENHDYVIDIRKQDCRGQLFSDGGESEFRSSHDETGKYLITIDLHNKMA